MSILLVDLTTADAAVLASALRVDGFEVAIAPSATEARAIVAGGSISVAIVDLMLRSEGGTTGLDLAREMRTLSPSMRVLLTSSYYLSERQLERADCGVCGFIPKPYDLDEVVAFVRRKSSAPPSSRRVWCGAETDEAGCTRPSGIDLVVRGVGPELEPSDLVNGSRR